ncbi:NAD-dependent epimerase/dehydratase family protein [Sphaerisporangium aureirubrum]|uniref:NAD-dependent epimerase/dehydratase family protein n=1 Tax=Sphaerisporangium aureirubrum TaxID=1544736 RepID=A0ABW1NHD8_9ACTN
MTGSAGMLGGGLVRRMSAEGYAVHGVDLRVPEETPPDVRHTVADIRDGERLRRAMDGMDVVVHTASALPSYPAATIRSIIVDGTATVLEAARRAGVPRVVHISSTAVYGLPSVVPTTEEYPRSPVDTYSRAKAAAEEVCERHRADGLCLPILRPKTFLGPGRMGLFSMLFEWADEGRDFPVLGRGDVRIQMLAVEDLLDAVMTAVTAPAEVAGDTYNLAAAEFGTLREDFQAVLDAAGHGGRVRSIPMGPAAGLLKLTERTGLSPVYGRLLRKLRGDSYVSIAKAAGRLGFRPRLSNREAILGTYRWWRETRDKEGSRSRGHTSRDPWRQGVLRLAKVFF